MHILAKFNLTLYKRAHAQIAALTTPIFELACNKLFHIEKAESVLKIVRVEAELCVCLSLVLYLAQGSFHSFESSGQSGENVS